MSKPQLAVGLMMIFMLIISAPSVTADTSFIMSMICIASIYLNMRD